MPEHILDDPLREGFALHGPTVLHAQRACNGRRQSIRGGGGDAVHHRAGEHHFAVDPLAELRIVQGGELRCGPRKLPAVVHQVVAAHHAERWRPAFAITAQRFDQEADDTARSARMLQIAADIRMSNVQRAVSGKAVALLGDGQRNDMRLRRREPLQHGFRALGRDEQLPDRTDYLVDITSSRIASV